MKKAVRGLLGLSLCVDLVGCAGGAVEPFSMNQPTLSSQTANNPTIVGRDSSLPSVVTHSGSGYGDSSTGDILKPNDDFAPGDDAMMDSDSVDEDPGIGFPDLNTPAPSENNTVPDGEPVEVRPDSRRVPRVPMNDYRNNFFKNYGVNPFVEVSTDPLSTFGADVDTASFGVTRAYLHQRQFPPVAAVRPEEFINSFDYNYPTPASGDFAIHTEMMPSPLSQKAHLLRVGIQARKIADAQRKPANLTFVIDVSGSMDRENRLGLVKRSLRLLLNQLRPEDRVAVVVYGNHARTLLAHTEVSERSAIDAVIASLRPEGSTNAEAGLLEGYAQASRAYRHGQINRVLLLSDGVANVGETGPDAIMRRIRIERENGITLTSLGFGMDGFNDTLMEQLANQGDGNYAYIDTLQEAEHVLSTHLTSTLQTLGKDFKVQVKFPEQYVEHYRLVGYENRDIADADFRNDAVDAGEVGAGHSVTALYEMRLTPFGQQALNEGSSRVSLADVTLRYKAVDDFSRIKEVERQASAERLAQSASDSLKLSACAAGFAETLRGSVFARQYSLTQLQNDLNALTINPQMQQAPKVQEFVNMVRRANNLRQPRHEALNLQQEELVERSDNPQQLAGWKQFLYKQLGG